MSFSITDIRAQLALGGARPSKFQVVLTAPPSGLGASSVAIAKIPFLVQASSIPDSTIGTVEVPYFGRKIKVAGDRTYQPWTIQVINDEDFLIRNFFETWMSSINSAVGNLNGNITSAPSQYQATGLVTQFSQTGVPIRTYEIQAAWPNQLSAIELSWSATDQIETFNVTLEFDDWVVQKSITGDGGGE